MFAVVFIHLLQRSQTTRPQKDKINCHEKGKPSLAPIRLFDFVITHKIIKNPSLLDQSGLKMSFSLCVCEGERKSRVMPQTALEMFHQQHQHHQSAVVSDEVNKISLLNPLTKASTITISLSLSLSL